MLRMSKTTAPVILVVTWNAPPMRNTVSSLGLVRDLIDRPEEAADFSSSTQIAKAFVESPCDERLLALKIDQ